MSLLSDNRIEELRDTLNETEAFQYSGELRRLLLSGINRDFLKFLRIISDNQFLQLWADLKDLNGAEKLTDGTVPFEQWLDKVGRIVKPFPNASKLVGQALEDIGKISSNIKSIAFIIQPPTAPQLKQIVKEQLIFDNDMVSYSFLEAGLKAGISVVRVHVKKYDNGQLRKNSVGEPLMFLGTGWLIAKDLIITNHHVINARGDNEPNATNCDFKKQAQEARVEFDYNADNTQGVFFTISKVEAFDEDLDYALLRLSQPVDRPPLSLLSKKIILTDDNAQVVNIIQHPLGNSKKVALRNNHIYDSPYPTVRYFSDTQRGSSGSPVFNDQWQVIALHRASSQVNNIQYQGRETAWVNEGVQLEALMRHLKNVALEIAAEIEV